jgi:hypothetical protein
MLSGSMPIRLDLTEYVLQHDDKKGTWLNCAKGDLDTIGCGGIWTLDSIPQHHHIPYLYYI